MLTKKYEADIPMSSPPEAAKKTLYTRSE